MVLLGVLVAVLPFLGFPGWMKTGFFVALGLVIAVVSYFSGVAYRSGDMNHSMGSSTKPVQEGRTTASKDEHDHPRA